jgi:magnesium chelatase subunit I
MAKPSTLRELTKSRYRVLPVKEEIRKNLSAKIRAKETIFPGIVGYDRTVIPQLTNALLSRHDILLLGLRGQAKTRLLRALPGLLDDEVPAMAGCPINDDPLRPTCALCRRVLAESGDAAPIRWVPRAERYREKLATPDVTIADLIGDIDPIKAARERLDFSDEGVIHYGIVPRTNRGIFALNELPDLQPRIQVGLLNILEEKDLQIRGFPVRLPLDLLVVFTANPEDYTNRGNIITPLKDRIDSQVITHYPQSIEDAMAITAQEAWVERGVPLRVPVFVREIVEEIAFEARTSEFIDQSSGVSARLTISAYENLLSNIERRALLTGEARWTPRICDLYAAVPAIAGKIELVYEGEREGPTIVSLNLIGRAINKVFQRRFPPVFKSKGKPSVGGEKDAPASGSPAYKEISDFFAGGGRIEIADDMAFAPYFAELSRVPGLARLAKKHVVVADDEEHALAMELVLDGLHQNSVVAKEAVDQTVRYSDMLANMFKNMKG